MDFIGFPRAIRALFILAFIPAASVHARPDVQTSTETQLQSFVETRDWLKTHSAQLDKIVSSGEPAEQRLRAHYLTRLRLLFDDFAEQDFESPSRPIAEINSDIRKTLSQLVLFAIETKSSKYGFYSDPFYRGQLGLIFSEAVRRSGDLSSAAAKQRVSLGFNHILAALVSGQDELAGPKLPPEVADELRKRSIYPDGNLDYWRYGLLVSSSTTPESADPKYLQTSIKNQIAEGRLDLQDLIARLISRLDQNQVPGFHALSEAEQIRIVAIFIHDLPQRAGRFYQSVYPEGGKTPVAQAEVSVLHRLLDAAFLSALDNSLPIDRESLLLPVERKVPRVTPMTPATESSIVTEAKFKNWFHQFAKNNSSRFHRLGEDWIPDFIVALANETLQYLHRGERIVGGPNHFPDAPAFYQITGVFYEILVKYWDKDEMRRGLLQRVAARAKFPSGTSTNRKREVIIESLSVLLPFYLLGVSLEELHLALGRPEISSMIVDFFADNRDLFIDSDKLGGILSNTPFLLAREGYEDSLAGRLDPKKEDAFWFYTLLINSDWTTDDLIVEAILEHANWSAAPKEIQGNIEIKKDLARLSLKHSGVRPQQFATNHRRFKEKIFKPAFLRGLHGTTGEILRNTYIESLQPKDVDEADHQKWRQERADQVANLLEQSFKSLPDFRYQFSTAQSIVDAIRQNIRGGSLSIERELIPDHPTHDFTIYCVRKYLIKLKTEQAQDLDSYWDGVLLKLQNQGPNVMYDANGAKVSIAPVDPKACRQLMLELSLPAPRLP